MKQILFGSLSHICGIVIALIGVEGIVMVVGSGGSPALIKTLPKFFGILVILAIVRGILRYGELSCNPEVKNPTEEELQEYLTRNRIAGGGIAAVVGILTSVYIFLQYPVAGIITALAFVVTGGMISSAPALDTTEIKGRIKEEETKVNRSNSDLMRGFGEIVQYRRGGTLFETMATRAEALNDAREDLLAVDKNRVLLRNFSILIFTIILVAVMYIAYKGGRVNIEQLLLVLMAATSSFGALRM